MKFNTKSGVSFTAAEFNLDHVNLYDIAHGLSFINRFAGQIDRAYNVAQHSVMVSYICKHLGEPVEVQLQALLHDATEAYIADIPAPWKHLLPDYAKLEKRIWTVISKAFGSPCEMFGIVTFADKVALAIEALYHLRNKEESVEEFKERFGLDRIIWDTAESGLLKGVRDDTFEAWSQQRSKGEFLRRFNELNDEILAKGKEVKNVSCN